MIDERTEEQAALYAFDLLEGSERLAFETRLAQESDLQELVRELRETASNLALNSSNVAPSPELKKRLMEMIAAPVASSKAEEEKIVSFPSLRWIPWSLAAGFAVLAAFLGRNMMSRRSENLALRTE